VRQRRRAYGCQEIVNKQFEYGFSGSTYRAILESILYTIHTHRRTVSVQSFVVELGAFR